MKATGIVRSIDELGRIVLPIELRRILDIKEHDSLEIFSEGDSIILCKYQPACIFCNDAESLTSFKSKNVCANCLQQPHRIWIEAISKASFLTGSKASASWDI